LREILSARLGVERSEDGIETVLRFIAQARARAISRRMENRLIAALFVAAGAWRRRESRGAHFRTDFPEAQKARRGFLTLKQAEAILSEALGSDYAPGAPGNEVRHQRSAL
jgi:L-aspartate oxidase